MIAVILYVFVAGIVCVTLEHFVDWIRDMRTKRWQRNYEKKYNKL